jgi:hypothetical protein
VPTRISTPRLSSWRAAYSQRRHEDPALLRVPQLGVVAQRVADEVGELGQRLDARVARSDEDEGQLPQPVRVVRSGVCRLQPLEHVVAQVDRVGKGLEADAVLGQAGDRQRARDRAERDHEVLVVEVEQALARLDLHPFAVEVEPRRPSEDELGMRAHHPQRHDHVAGLERARRRLRQHRREQHRVLGADDGCPALAELPGHVAAREAATDDHRPTLRVPLAHGSTIARWRGCRWR